MRAPRPRLFQPHTGSHTPRPVQGWPSDLDIATARRDVKQFIVLNPVAERQPLAFAQLVLLYEQQHRAARVLCAALDRELAR